MLKHFETRANFSHSNGGMTGELFVDYVETKPLTFYVVLLSKYSKNC